uniref:MANSC domain-containing protein n=1 Tax=Plectus sambesii TaxID=2011161 RepID=A0A914WXI9_9BILA
MRPLASVFCCLFLWQTCRSLPLLSGCSLDNDVALILRDSRLNGSAAVAVAAPTFNISFERCAELCCANEGCNALEFQNASGKRLAICLQYSCDDMMDCQGKVDREDDVTVAVWLEKIVNAAYSSSSKTVTSKSTSSTLTPLASKSSALVKSAVTPAGPSNATDRVKPSPAESKAVGILVKENKISESAVETASDIQVVSSEEATDRVEPSPAKSKVAGILPKANKISEIAVETTSARTAQLEPSNAELKVIGILPKTNKILESAVVTEDDPDSTADDDDLFRMLVGDRLAEETAHKPRNLLSNISVGMLAAGMIVFGLLLLVIATQLCREKNRIRYTSLA